uniref:Ubiquitin-like protease family profile domain-containing protein n=1 Tax=Aegilops tauschii TaxID=37682 RepID=M8CT66_AEGTA
MVMIPVLENLDPENANGTHHYWLLNINLRDKRFEVFDSWRMLKKSKRLDDVARAIVAAVHVLWDKYYPKQAKTMDKFSLVDIDAPKQTVSGDCSIFAWMNALLWNGTWLPNYEESDIPNIKKKMTISMLKCDLNKIPRQEILKPANK